MLSFKCFTRDTSDTPEIPQIGLFLFISFFKSFCLLQSKIGDLCLNFCLKILGPRILLEELEPTGDTYEKKLVPPENIFRLSGPCKTLQFQANIF